MSPALDDLLCQRYPLIFADRHRQTDDCGIGRGFECGDGWLQILDGLCSSIQFLIDHDNRAQVVALRCKEKLGTLRFYVAGGDAEIMGMIGATEEMSGRTCEVCGKPGSLAHLMTRCPEHSLIRRYANDHSGG